MDVINLIERDMFKYLSCICDLFIKGKAIFLEVYLTDIRGTCSGISVGLYLYRILFMNRGLFIHVSFHSSDVGNLEELVEADETFFR